MIAKLQIIFYSMYGHIYKMTEAVAAGVREVEGVDVEIYRVPELVPMEILQKSGAKAAQAAYEHIPLINPEIMKHADGYLFGTPTRFGNMCAQMRNFFDQLGGLRYQDFFVGKVSSVFASTGTQHGGQETTITSFHTTLFHLGMLVIGVPYSENKLTNMTEITGSTPYGATTLSGADIKSTPTENELAIARYQGQYVAKITRDLKLGRSQKYA